MKFKKMMMRYDRDERYKIIRALKEWVLLQNPPSYEFANWLENLLHANLNETNSGFKEHFVWYECGNHSSLPAFQQIVKSKLAVPKALPVKAEAAIVVRKTIPKKIKEAVWEAQFGDSLNGECFCCRKTLRIMDAWHAGHIVASCMGGTDTPDNLRAVCIECNLAMGSENMNDFKKRCYP
jgi:hypothetical protein